MSRPVRPSRRKAPLRRRRPMTLAEKAGIGSALTVVGLIGVGVVLGVLIDRLIDFSDVLDAGGEWDEGGGVTTRWY